MKRSHAIVLAGALTIGGLAIWLWPGHCPAPAGSLTDPVPVAAIIPRPAVVLPESSPVRRLTDPDQSLSARDLLAVIQALPPVLTSPEQSAILATLRSGLRPLRFLSPGDRYQIANDLMLALRSRREAVTGLPAALAAIAADESLESVFRDYAIQHLGSWLATHKEGGAESSVAMEALFAAAGRVSWSSAGSALLALLQVAEETVTLPRNRLLAAADAVVLAPSADPAARISALQVRSRLTKSGDAPEAFLVRVRALAASQSESPSVRASALAAIGQCGSPADLSLVSSMTSDSRLGDAARAATLRIEQRTARESAKSISTIQ